MTFQTKPFYILLKLLLNSVIPLHNSLADLFENRLAVAKELGASRTLLIKRGESSQEVANKVTSLLGAMPDKTIECTGTESAIQTGIYVRMKFIGFKLSY